MPRLRLHLQSRQPAEDGQLRGQPAFWLRRRFTSRAERARDDRGAGTYTYNGLHQLIERVVTNSGTLDGTTHYVHDRGGNVIAELNAAGAVAREYIWLPEAEIAPTAASRAPIDRPAAVVDGVNATPATYYVHTDHLHRPIRMTNAAKSFVWSAEYQPWSAVQSLSGPLTLDLRFPGQWFQLEAGLHYNWHRHYDSSLGRYTQPDPLGFVDGPSVYGYAGGSPLRYVDPDGRNAITYPVIIGGTILSICARYPKLCARIVNICRGAFSRESTGSGGGGGGPSDKCQDEIRQARLICTEAYVNNWESDYDVGPYKKPKGAGKWNIQDCMRGLISEECGGNRKE